MVDGKRNKEKDTKESGNPKARLKIRYQSTIDMNSLSSRATLQES
jgi:hypothetical protein